MGRYERKVPFRENAKKKMKMILPVLLLVVIALLAGLLLLGKLELPGGGIGLGAAPEETTAPVVKDPDSIAIPGYEGISLTADKKKQTVAFHNPARNTCLFVISLRLEDGTLLWQSKEVRPGKKTDPVVLKQALPAGTYPNASLEYACFTDDANRTPLNGATTKLTLRVG